MKLQILAALALVAIAEAGSAETLLCVTDKIAVAANGVVNVSAVADTGSSVQVRWTSAAGRFEPASGTGTVWHADGAAPGKYSLLATAEIGGGSQSCTLSFVIPQVVLGLADIRSYFLQPKENEPEGFASYSYILLGSHVTKAREPAARETIRAFLTLLNSIGDLKAVTSKHAFNLTMLPVKEAPPEVVFEQPSSDAAVDWVFQKYDYARAQSILKKYSATVKAQTRRDIWTGPYIVSHRNNDVVVQDLSNVRPNLADRWVELHVTQVTQQGDWKAQNSGSFALRLMTVMNTWAEGVAKTKQVVSGWLVWFEPLVKQ